MEKDYYEILGVGKKATKAEIKKAFRNLSKKHHPDVGGDEEEFKRIQEAYETLSDDKKRAAYDSGGVYVSEDEMEKKARANLIHAFLSALNGGLISNIYDPFEVISTQIAKARTELNQKIDREREEIERYKDVHNRMKPKDSFFHIAIDGEIDMCERNIMMLEHELEINAEMKRILKEGNFEFDRQANEYQERYLSRGDGFYIGEDY